MSNEVKDIAPIKLDPIEQKLVDSFKGYRWFPVNWYELYSAKAREKGMKPRSLNWVRRVRSGKSRSVHTLMILSEIMIETKLEAERNIEIIQS